MAIFDGEDRETVRTLAFGFAGIVALCVVLIGLALVVA